LQQLLADYKNKLRGTNDCMTKKLAKRKLIAMEQKILGFRNQKFGPAQWRKFI